MKKLKLMLALAVSLWMPLAVTPLIISCGGCKSTQSVPVTEGHDPVIVYAERAQTSSLAIYKNVTEWELNNRAVLPAEVSRIVDTIRREFPPAWGESRNALELYKLNVTGTNTTTMERVTGALLVFQDTLIRLQNSSSPNEVTQVQNSLSSLISSIRLLVSNRP